ncbi:GHMP kinase [Rhodothermaceae bacterium RA]|nr:GHMP kinase [Rhodothermaceae bacterium RA]
MIIHTSAYARAGLIGNPSDGYYGKTISLIVRNFAARVTCYESPRVAIRPGLRDHLEFESREALVEDVRLNGYYGGIRLIKATIKAFSDYCERQGIHLDRRNFTIEYATDIPVRIGLAGSSGIITATMRALMNFYGVVIPRPQLPNLILSVEVDELGLGAGLQDRVIQVYEGVVFMDFDRETMERQGFGRYEPLPVENLPPLFVAYHDGNSEGSEVTHNDLRSRFRRGDPVVLEAMQTFAAYAREARDLIVAGRGDEIGPLMDANFDLRARITQISPRNQKLIDIGRQCGTHVKFAGSGGAVIGVYDGDPERLRVLENAYAEFGARVIVPQIDE